jgi:hypothetical protein
LLPSVFWRYLPRLPRQPRKIDTHRQHHGRWHGAANAGTAYGNARYQSWPYAPGQDRIDEGHGFYEGYGFNSNNSCYPGESMYDGC